MTLAVCIMDTRDHAQAAHVMQHTIHVLSECHAAHKAYWISDVSSPVKFTVPQDEIQISPIQQFPLDYNRICLQLLPQLIQEDHCLIIQTDGHAVNASAWTSDFLNYDYIGACWPHTWNLPHAVGNGGFSLRSRKLLQALAHMNVPVTDHHEDYQICLNLRPHLMNSYACVWAPDALADQFSIENNMHSPWLGKSLGFHGKHLKSLYMGTPDA